jgi:hypothetical protein
LNIELNLDFPVERPEDFYEQAQASLDTIVKEAMDWKIMHAFFIVTGYVKRPVQQAGQFQGNDGVYDDATLPPQDRRFELKTKAKQLSAEQQVKPLAQSATRRLVGIAFVNERTTLRLETGFARTTHFLYDSWDDEFRQTVLQKVPVHGGWRLASTKAEVEAWHAEDPAATSNTNTSEAQVAQESPTPTPRGGRRTKSRGTQTTSVEITNISSDDLNVGDSSDTDDAQPVTEGSNEHDQSTTAVGN